MTFNKVDRCLVPESVPSSILTSGPVSVTLARLYLPFSLFVVWQSLPLLLTIAFTLALFPGSWTLQSSHIPWPRKRCRNLVFVSVRYPAPIVPNRQLLGPPSIISDANRVGDFIIRSLIFNFVSYHYDYIP